MNRLYYCSAKCDENTLRSYFTDVIYNDGEFVNMFVYGSQATYQHINKYFKWLIEHGKKSYSDKLYMLYKSILKNKSTRYGCLNLETGEIILGKTNSKMGYEITH